MSDSQEFRVRPGKAKRSKAQGRNARGLVAEVLRIAAMSGGSQRAGWGGSRRRGQSSFGKGRTAFARSRLFGSGRRVASPRGILNNRRDDRTVREARRSRLARPVAAG